MWKMGLYINRKGGMEGDRKKHTDTEREGGRPSLVVMSAGSLEARNGGREEKRGGVMYWGLVGTGLRGRGSLHTSCEKSITSTTI